MGSSSSKCTELLDQMGWQRPQFAEEFYHDSLINYLQVQNLEVVLPKHAPQADVSIPDRKPAMFPRPNFCWEAYKMHLALIGPSTECKTQFIDFLPKVVPIFKGTPARLAPGREAVPYYFFEPDLHRMVLWELPEIAWKQGCEDYVRELGLLYIDCVFMLFSDKYMLSDIYCKLCVSMAIHGIPFFVICQQSPDCDMKQLQTIKHDFQRKDILVRLLNPRKPGQMLEELISDFFKEVTWNRSSKDREVTDNVSEEILGQTVRLKNLEKKPELNGKCGVCIGYDKEQQRYRVRLILSGGVETDIALKQASLSILKPKLLDAMVKIKDLESKPELNGRFGFVDAFLRETERYSVLVPDKPGTGLVLALKSANLEKVTATTAQPVRTTATPTPTAKPAAKPSAPSDAGYPAASPKATPSASSTSPQQPSTRAQPAASTPPAAASRDAGVKAEAARPKAPPARVEEEDEEKPRASLRLSAKGLIGLRVWAVVGDPDEAEELIDYLMDCGKTVFSVSPSGGQVKSADDLNSNPKLPNVEVLALTDSTVDVNASVDAAARLGLRGIILHPDTEAFPGLVARCKGLGLAVHGVNILDEVEPGGGLPVAPLD